MQAGPEEVCILYAHDSTRQIAPSVDHISLIKRSGQIRSVHGIIYCEFWSILILEQHCAEVLRSPFCGNALVNNFIFVQQHSPGRVPIFQTPTLLPPKRGHIGIDKHFEIWQERMEHKWCANFTILLIRTLWSESPWYTHNKACVDMINVVCCLHSLTDVDIQDH